MNFVTSFRTDSLYWRRFIESYRKHVPYPLTVFYEGKRPRFRGIHWVDLMKDTELQVFLEDWGEIETAHGIRYIDGKRHEDYRWNAVKFSKKVFAVTSPERPKGKWVWCDADVIFTSDFKHERKACPDGKISYLGRKDWHHSECGWVSYDEADDFLQTLRWMYTSGAVFELKEWHDSYVWDVVKESFGPKRFKNLSPGAKGLDVWEQSVLDEFSEHYKGPAAKQRKYG